MIVLTRRNVKMHPPPQETSVERCELRQQGIYCLGRIYESCVNRRFLTIGEYILYHGIELIGQNVQLILGSNVSLQIYHKSHRNSDIIAQTIIEHPRHVSFLATRTSSLYHTLEAVFARHKLDQKWKLVWNKTHPSMLLSFTALQAVWFKQNFAYYGHYHY